METVDLFQRRDEKSFQRKVPHQDDSDFSGAEQFHEFHEFVPLEHSIEDPRKSFPEGNLFAKPHFRIMPPETFLFGAAALQQKHDFEPSSEFLCKKMLQSRLDKWKTIVTQNDDLQLLAHLQTFLDEMT